MIATDLTVAFATAPLPLSTKSTFCSSKTKLSKTPPVFTKRHNRARVVALGAPPPSPPPKEPDEGADQSEARSEAVPDATEESSTDAPPEEVTADDILNSPSFLKKKLEIVQKELIEAKKALDQDSDDVKEEKERYVRLAADFENYRRRSLEDLRKQDDRSTAKVCKEILDVLDNFERASDNVDPQTEREEAISTSYQSINKQLLDSLVKLKVEQIEAVGHLFDPEMHEAIQKMESTEYREDFICAQFRSGYRIGSTLIRAAVVAVSSGPGPESAEEEPADTESAEDTAEDAVEHGGPLAS